MGGRGGSIKTGGATVAAAFSVPRMSTTQISRLSRKSMEDVATALFANNAVKSGLTQTEGVRRARALMSGNSDAQLRKYIAKYNK